MRPPTFLVCLAALGCTQPPVPPPSVSPPPTAAPVTPAPSAVPDEAPKISLNLDSAQAFELLAAMEEFGGEPVLVDAAALASLLCAGVSVKTPGSLPGRVAAEKVAAALRALHYRVDHETGRWVVSADPASPPAACARPASAAPPAVADEPADEAAREIARSIRRVSDTEYVITRRGVDTLFEHAPALLKHTRFVPESQSGTVVGIRVFGVRPDDTLGRLGLQNGDRLQAIGGKSMNDPQQALEAYTALRNAKRAVLEIVRQGAPVKILYRVE